MKISTFSNSYLFQFLFSSSYYYCHVVTLQACQLRKAFCQKNTNLSDSAGNKWRQTWRKDENREIKISISIFNRPSVKKLCCPITLRFFFCFLKWKFPNEMTRFRSISPIIDLIKYRNEIEIVNNRYNGLHYYGKTVKVNKRVTR